MIAATILPLALLGALLGLDVVSFPQAMISRPIASATITGALVGQPTSGLIIGAALELIALDTLPFGASRYPEWGSASVVGGAIFSMHPSHPAGALTVALVSALATGWLGGWSMVQLRRLNAVWARQRRDAIEAGARGSIISLQLMGMTADLIRGGALTALGFAVFAPVATIAIGRWWGSAGVERTFAVAIAASVTGGAAWRLYHATIGARWFFLSGLVVGLVLLLVR